MSKPSRGDNSKRPYRVTLTTVGTCPDPLGLQDVRTHRDVTQSQLAVLYSLSVQNILSVFCENRADSRVTTVVLRHLLLV